MVHRLAGQCWNLKKRLPGNHFGRSIYDMEQPSIRPPIRASSLDSDGSPAKAEPLISDRPKHTRRTRNRNTTCCAIPRTSRTNHQSRRRRCSRERQQLSYPWSSCRSQWSRGAVLRPGSQEQVRSNGWAKVRCSVPIHRSGWRKVLQRSIPRRIWIAWTGDLNNRRTRGDWRRPWRNCRRQEGRRRWRAAGRWRWCRLLIAASSRPPVRRRIEYRVEDRG